MQTKSARQAEEDSLSEWKETEESGQVMASKMPLVIPSEHKRTRKGTGTCILVPLPFVFLFQTSCPFT